MKKSHYRFAVMMSLCLALFLAVFCPANAQSYDQKPLLVLYAFDAEGEQIAAAMTTDSTERLLGRVVHIGQLSGKQIILAESGIGMTNAAMTMQKLIDQYQPKAVVFSGIAGAIDTTILIGDLCVCDRWATHDYFYHGHDQIKPAPIRSYSAQVDSIRMITFFQTDSGFVVLADNIDTDKLNLKSIGERKPKIVVGGAGVSGNAFIDNAEKRIWLQENYSAQITDMESAAVAQVCIANGVPFIIIRSASDLAGGSANKSAREELNQFFQVAADNSSSFVIELIRLLP